VSAVVADLQDDGQIDRGWLGVQIKPVSDEVASVLGLEAGQGTMIEKVMDGTPAQKAGLQSGDIVLSFDGTKIGEARDLTRGVAGTAPDTVTKVEVLRKGERLTLDVTLANRATAQDA
jgi:serine protease Do